VTREGVATARAGAAVAAQARERWRREMGRWWWHELGRWRRREQRLRWQGGGGRRGAGELEDGGVWAQVRPEDAGRRSGQRQWGIIDDWGRGSVVGLGI
jgi:hypothetical protein